MTLRMGWFCSYTPLEIALAGGFMPFRIRGHLEPVKKADSYLHPNMCQYVKSCLDMALDGAYDTIDAFVFANSCDAMRRLYDAWERYATRKPTFFLDLPKGRSDLDCSYFARELEKWVQSLEAHFAVTITEAALSETIAILATSRSLYQRLNSLRMEIPAKVSTCDILEVSSRFFTTLPAEWNRTAEELLEKKSQATASGTGKPRVLLAGSPIHEWDVIDVIEECGLLVVYEDLCTGSRFFDVKVDNTGSPLSDLARAYLKKSPCSRMARLEDRTRNLLEAARKFKVDGIIHYNLKFCDTYLYDIPPLKQILTRAGYKSLFIEGDCGSFGQLKTRIEAFAEILRSGKFS